MCDDIMVEMMRAYSYELAQELMRYKHGGATALENVEEIEVKLGIINSMLESIASLEDGQVLALNGPSDIIYFITKKSD